MSQLEWTEEQWARVNAAVTEEFNKVSVAGAILPCYGPVAGGMETVSTQKLTRAPGANMSVDDTATTSFWTLRVLVRLSRQQIQDDNLASALFAFKRAASLLARSEDSIVFNGYNTGAALISVPDPAALGTFRLGMHKPFVSDVITTTGKTEDGLLATADGQLANFNMTPAGIRDYSDGLVDAVTNAVNTLEANGFPGPYGCVLSNNVFGELHRSEIGRLVLAADRVKPILGGPLLRSGVMLKDYAVVASSAGDAIDIVVATPPKVQFLQIETDAKYVFRVYERFVLRIKEKGAVVAIALTT